MAESRRYGPGIQLDIGQIILEARNRWLRPAEICEILRNYKQFQITPEPPHMPENGSLFLFDRKVLRYFRKDGHSWRKKKDGKTVKEAHERLKAGSIDVLHCYYAHGEENESFQRRSYWMLEEALSHIVLVHYREVKGSRTNFYRSNETGEAFPNSQESEEVVANPDVDSSVSSIYQPNGFQTLSQNTDTTSLNGAQTPEYEDVESVYNHQDNSRLHSFVELQQPMMQKTDPGSSAPYFPVPFSNDYERKFSGTPLKELISLAQEENGLGPQKQLDLPLWEDMLENCTAGIQSAPFQSSFSPAHGDAMGIIPKLEKESTGQLFMDGYAKKQEFSTRASGQEDWQVSPRSDFSCLSVSPSDQKFPSDTEHDLKANYDGEKVNCANLHDYLQLYEADPDKKIKHPMQNNIDMLVSEPDVWHVSESESVSNMNVEAKPNYSSAAKQHLLDHSWTRAEGLNKIDSFNRWMSKELGDVDDSHIQSSSGTYWDTVESENVVDDPSIPSQVHLDGYTLAPSLSHDQLFSIIDFSPNWAYAGCETKILIIGKFLKNQTGIENYNWSCMFGEVEVPAEVMAHGVLRCHAPLHKPGRVPFYVTCSNRLACSEVREFEYRVNHIEDVNVADESTDLLQARLAKLLTLNSVSASTSPSSSVSEISHLSSKIDSFLKVEDHNEWIEMLKITSKEKFSVDEVKEQLLEEMLKENLQIWLLQKVAAGGKGPSVLGEDGQGVLHLAAALGYDWVIPPTLAAGVSVNFRDVNGWTALHWAASYGRERTVVSLVSQGAAPGALTDPTPMYPSGRTPADLASANGHKGISGYLAESALSVQLSTLDLKDSPEAVSVPGVKAVQSVSERIASPVGDNDLPYGLSLKDSLAAVCNATQAAARIHQAFRVQSFRRKQLIEYGDNEFGMSDERALSLIALKTHKSGYDEPVHAAAVRIQNKFRSWKGRKDFLITRRRIVRIQAHFRGHQVRKNYRKIVWSVGIVEKVILRWRRKGSGLRGFKPALGEVPNGEGTSSKEDDYDFLKEGRKQTEERLQKALARVKSMAQYPEGRDQYRRLLTVVTELQEKKVEQDQILDDSEGIADIDNELIDLEALMDDDAFMPSAS